MVRANEGPTTILARRGYNSRVKERTRKTPSSRNSGIRSMPKTRLAALPFAGILFVVSGGLAAAAEQVSAEPAAEVLSAEEAAFFETKVRPVLAEHCYKCHSAKAEKLKAELYLDSRAGMLKGGELGPAINLEKAEDSLLLKAIGWKERDLQMPPRKALPKKVVEDFTEWVNMGAPWPGDQPAVAIQPKAGIDFETERTSHWAWQPIQKPVLPETAKGKEIDFFIGSGRSASIQGESGSGKSTTARAICEKFKYIHVDTGLHYRAVSLHLLNLNISSEDAPEYLLSSPLILSSKLDEFSVQLSIDGIHYSKSELRTERMNREVSYYARLPEVRSLLLDYQRRLPDFGKKLGFSGVIMDGRDIGSVILPNADIKIFLYADLQVRQHRRSSDGETDSISTRDQIDSTRKIAPLTCPDDALSIDTGKLPLEQVLQLISQKIASLS